MQMFGMADHIRRVMPALVMLAIVLSWLLAICCSSTVDYCQSKPCQNGGLCSNGDTTYSCYCLDTDYDGPTCNSWINDCQPSPCQNGGRCTDGLRSYTCDCSATDFYGTNCQSRIDDCSPNRCQNGASCTDGFRNYTCNCYDGFSGRDCSIDFEDCTPHLCQNGGLCLERSNQKYYGLANYPPPFNGTFSYANAAGYVCWCPSGAFGVNCEINPNDCVLPGTNQSVCAHASSCTDGLASFTCHCLAGYEGANCSQEIDECRAVPPPCPSGATCIDRLADFKCTNCPAGLGGRKCSVPLTGCDSTPCRNNATCEPVLVSEFPTAVHDFRCHCKPEFNFGGRNCSVQLPSFSFGLNGTASSATFMSLVGNSTLLANDSWTIELKLVTLSPGAFLMLLGNMSDSGRTPRLLITIDATGHLSAQLLLSNGSQIESVTSADSVATGSFVYVKIALSISGRELSLTVASTARSTSLSSAAPLPQLSGQLLIGGFNGAPAAPTPVVGVRSRSKISVPSLPVSIASALTANVTAFRGIIAAPILNGNKPLMLGPVEATLTDSLPEAVAASDSTGVVIGAVTESVCNTSWPCENGAVCTDVFYNSYTCNCTTGWHGYNCSIADYCYSGAKFCPSGTSCVNLQPTGYECRTAVTFGSSWQPQPVTQLSLSASGDLSETLARVEGWARTRQTDGQLLSVSSGSRQLVIKCNSGQFQVSLDNQVVLIAASVAMGMPFDFSVNISVGAPISVRLFLDGVGVSSSTKSPITADFPLNSAALVSLGGADFKGCLDNVRLNGYLVPLVSRALPVGSPGFHWLLGSESPLIGCHSNPVCQTAGRNSACQNGGNCTDIWNDFQCDCAEGFSGKNCGDSDRAVSSFSYLIIIAVCSASIVLVIIIVSVIVCLRKSHKKESSSAASGSGDTEFALPDVTAPTVEPRRRLPTPPCMEDSRAGEGYLHPDTRPDSYAYPRDSELLQAEDVQSTQYVLVAGEVRSEELTTNRPLPPIPTDEGVYLSDDQQESAGNSFANQPYQRMVANVEEVEEAVTDVRPEESQTLNTYDEP